MPTLGIPTSAPIVTSPTVETATTLIPETSTGSASGSSTVHRSVLRECPTAVAPSITVWSTEEKASLAVLTRRAMPYRPRAAMMVSGERKGVPMTSGTATRSGSEGIAYISVAPERMTPPTLGKRCAKRPIGTDTKTARAVAGSAMNR